MTKSDSNVILDRVALMKWPAPALREAVIKGSANVVDGRPWFSRSRPPRA